MEIMCYKLSIGYDPNVEKNKYVCERYQNLSVMKKNICFSIICMESHLLYFKRKSWSFQDKERHSSLEKK